MSKIEEVVAGIDFDLLRKQKLAVLEHIEKLKLTFSTTPLPTLELSGIINMLDDIQDAVVEDGIKTEAEVFGRSECDHNIVDASNEVVKSGYVCTECGDIFTTPDGKEVNDETTDNLSKM